jgi:hypothetical protein
MSTLFTALDEHIPTFIENFHTNLHFKETILPNVSFAMSALSKNIVAFVMFCDEGLMSACVWYWGT